MDNIKLPDDLEQVEKTTKLKEEDGTVKHQNLIPRNLPNIKAVIDDLPLTKKEKQAIFIFTHKTLDIINQSGMYQWFPDKLKPAFYLIFAQGYTDDKSFRKALRKLIGEEKDVKQNPENSNKGKSSREEK